jgi:hypothetical protein
LVGSGVFLSVWPWTMAVMMSDIKKNLEEDVMQTAGMVSLF